MTQQLTDEQSERIRDFVAALRSGEYAQTSNQLGKMNDCGEKMYCCEGVAVERYAADFEWESKWDGKSLILINPVQNDEYDGGEQHDYAEDEFWELMALSTGSDNGTSTLFAFVLPEGHEVLDTGATSISFMALNDDGFTFPQIADLIEWQFLACPAS